MLIFAISFIILGSMGSKNNKLPRIRPLFARICTCSTVAWQARKVDALLPTSQNLANTAEALGFSLGSNFLPLPPNAPNGAARPSLTTSSYYK